MGLNRKKKDFRAAVDLTNTFGERSPASLWGKEGSSGHWGKNGGDLIVGALDPAAWRTSIIDDPINVSHWSRSMMMMLPVRLFCSYSKLQLTAGEEIKPKGCLDNGFLSRFSSPFLFYFLRWTIGSFVKNKSLFFFFFCHPIRQRWGVTNSHIADRSAIALHPWYYFQEPLMEKNDWFTVSFRINGHRTSAQKMIYLFFSLSINKI